MLGRPFVPLGRMRALLGLWLTPPFPHVRPTGFGAGDSSARRRRPLARLPCLMLTGRIAVFGTRVSETASIRHAPPRDGPRRTLQPARNLAEAAEAGQASPLCGLVRRRDAIALVWLNAAANNGRAAPLREARPARGRRIRLDTWRYRTMGKTISPGLPGKAGMHYYLSGGAIICLSRKHPRLSREPPSGRVRQPLPPCCWARLVPCPMYPALGAECHCVHGRAPLLTRSGPEIPRGCSRPIPDLCTAVAPPVRPQ